MNGILHYDLTRRWAMEVGFTAEEAEAVARWNVRTDVGFRGRDAWANKRYHLVPFGAHAVSRAYVAHAIEARSIPHLGVALHAMQDAIGHGWLGSLLHWPGIDIWDRRSPAVRARIERTTRDWLLAYLDFRMPAEVTSEGALASLPLPPDLGPIGRRGEA